MLYRNRFLTGRVVFACSVFLFFAVALLSLNVDAESPPVVIGHSGSCGGCACSNAESTATGNHIVNEHHTTREFITEQFRLHENWLFGNTDEGGYLYNGVRDGFWELHVSMALMMMAEQLVSTGMLQMLALGTFFDAETQLETQLLFQRRAAQAHKDYHPTLDMCTIGTTARGLASSDRNGEFTSFVLSQRQQDRNLGMYANSAPSSTIDRESRIRQVKERYCDSFDNNTDLDELCGAGAGAATVNRDIDYTRTIDQERTLHIDFTDTVPTADEQDVLALLSNLFSYDVLDKPKKIEGELEASEGAYLAMRSLLAKRSVAETSINAIVGMKTAGTQKSENKNTFTQNVMEQLGVTDEDDQLRLIGGYLDNRIDPAERPSYYAQMEILAQKMYLDEKFFINLYDKPINIERKQVAMQAINLMLERDMHKSELRSEMVLSVWLEVELMKYQRDVQNRINALEEKTEKN